jgi:hypothetical protein
VSVLSSSDLLIVPAPDSASTLPVISFKPGLLNEEASTSSASLCRRARHQKARESKDTEYALIHIMKLCANILQNQQFLHFILKLRKATLRQNTSTSWRRAKTWYNI